MTRTVGSRRIHTAAPHLIAGLAWWVLLSVGCGSGTAGEGELGDGGVDGRLPPDAPGRDTSIGTDGRSRSDAPLRTDAPSRADAGPDAPTGQDAGPGGTDAADANSGPLALSVLTEPNAFLAIFDAVPSSDGTVVYFTAVGLSGAAGVYSVAVGIAPSPATLVASGGPLVAPFGIAISASDQTLYVADPGAVDSSGNDSGAIYQIASAGGTPMQVAGSSGYVPRGITIATSTDTLVFTGVTTGGIGVFSLPAAGGAVTPIAAGSPFVDPSGVATDPAGNIYVADTTAGGSHRADVFKITAGVVSVLAPDIYVGYPAGVAFSSSTQAVVVSGLLSVGGPDTLSSISPSGVITPFLSTGLSTLEAAAGLHRASIANAFAFVDSAGDGTDAVYVIK